MDNLRESSEQVLKQVALCKVAPDQLSRKSYWSASDCLVKGDFADNYREAELIFSITTTYLLVNLLEDYPPVVSNLEGNRLTLDPCAYAHKDQIDCCMFSWPIKDDPQFKMFFHYAKNGKFDSNELFSRFCFIDHETGKLSVKNGSAFHLLNGLGFSDALTEEYCDFIKSLDGYYVFWSEVPDEDEYRDFLGCIDVNEDFSKAINTLFDDHSANSDLQPNVGKIGRPKLRDEVARAYSSMFPAGHLALGLTWKKVALKLTEKMGRTITVATLRRGLRESDEQK